MCKSNSGFSGNFSGSGSFKPRQICDLTNLKGCKFGYFDNRSDFALYLATFSYAHRWPQAETAENEIKILIFETK